MKKITKSAKLPIDEKNIVESILIDDEEEEQTSSEQNTFQDSIKELGNQLFLKHPEKTSNVSNDNNNGLLRADVLNDYMESNFGYRYNALDTLVTKKPSRALSHNGFGIEKLIEIVKNISASFEQTQLPARMRDYLNR